MSAQFTPSQLEAQRRMNLTLDLIEQAQRLVGKACELMCPITPLCDDWERLGRLYDKVHAEWHTMNLVRNGTGYDLDRDAKAQFEAKLKPEVTHG